MDTALRKTLLERKFSSVEYIEEFVHHLERAVDGLRERYHTALSFLIPTPHYPTSPTMTAH